MYLLVYLPIHNCVIYYFVYSRVWEHCPEDYVGADRHDHVRHGGRSPLPPLGVQHRHTARSGRDMKINRHFSFFPIPGLICI